MRGVLRAKKLSYIDFWHLWVSKPHNEKVLKFRNGNQINRSQKLIAPCFREFFFKYVATKYIYFELNIEGFNTY